MDLKSIYHDAKVTVCAVKAGDNEEVKGAAVDMSGYEGVAFAILVDSGETVAGWQIKAQQSTDNSVAHAFADLKDTAVGFSSAAASELARVLDIYQPTERYVRPVVTVPNMTTPTPFAVVAIQYGARTVPVTQPGGEFHAYPAEGTA